MNLNTDWAIFLSNELHKNYFIKLQTYLNNVYKTKTIFPPYDNIFRAFNLLPLIKVKVVIIGQDPYHGLNQANGLAFSVSEKSKIPPSLKNIYKELIDDIGCEYPENGNLEKWAREGILLINSVLTVEEMQANSHQKLGWEKFTDTIISKLSDEYENLVFILWGAAAQNKEALIDRNKHFIIKSSHPSPLSAYRGFFGSKPFSKTNSYLIAHSLEPINWCLPVQRTLL